MKKILLLITILIITTVQVVTSNPCETLNETSCIDSYNNGYTTSDECNSMYYCYPKYNNNIFTECTLITRTDFTSCTYSFSTCYNNLAIDPTQTKSCMCGQGTEFKTIDACGNPLNWSGVCIKPQTCTKETRTYLNKEVEIYTNCEVIEEQTTISCDKLTHDEESCYSNKLITTRLFYKPNECGTECVLDKTIIVEQLNCDTCQNNICYKEDKQTTTSSTTSQSSTTTSSSSSKSTEQDSTPNQNFIPETTNENTDEVDITKEPKKELTFKIPEIKILEKKNFPTEILTISLVFTALLLAGFVFLVKTN
ncbi:hypothetical protein JXM83_01130 [Candidatus Woesearchaeota archaeon]|nr:hypothetical protein [Candidatus Woesearchaeota archaeon]